MEGGRRRTQGTSFHTDDGPLSLEALLSCIWALSISIFRNTGMVPGKIQKEEGNRSALQHMCRTMMATRNTSRVPLSEPLFPVGAKAESPSQELVALPRAGFLKEQSLGSLGGAGTSLRQEAWMQWSGQSRRAKHTLALTWHLALYVTDPFGTSLGAWNGAVTLTEIQGDGTQMWESDRKWVCYCEPRCFQGKSISLRVRSPASATSWLSHPRQCLTPVMLAYTARGSDWLFLCSLFWPILGAWWICAGPVAAVCRTHGCPPSLGQVQGTLRAGRAPNGVM